MPPLSRSTSSAANRPATNNPDHSAARPVAESTSDHPLETSNIDHIDALTKQTDGHTKPDADAKSDLETVVAKPTPKTHFIALLITFVVVALAVLFGILLITKKGVFHEPGKIIFSSVQNDSASDDNTENHILDTSKNTPADSVNPVTEVGQDFINENLQGIELKSDLVVYTRTVIKKLPDAAANPNADADAKTETASGNSESTQKVTGNILYQILLPTTDFYDATTSVTPEAAQDKTLVSVWDLTSNQKLLAIDDENRGDESVDNGGIKDENANDEDTESSAQYYLDTFNSGAFFEYYVLKGDPADVAKVKSILEAKIQPFPTSEDVFTFAQTGVTALSRGMNRKLAQVGNAKFFAANIGPFLSRFDLTHTSNESSFSTAATDRNICSKPDMIDAITSSGIDIIELTGNHNQDCGDEAAIATIDQYHSLGLKTVGGGKTAAEAAIPLEISDKGTNLTLLAYNYSTGGYTTDNTPGANFYTPEKAQADIAAAKERGDFIIVDIQFFECNSYVNTAEDTTCDYANSSAGDQIGFFRHLIDLGANIVVGTSAHQPQTFELYKTGAIYYGLGNLFFDQSWWPGTTRSIILAHYFLDGKLLQTRLVPTVYDHNYQTKLMEVQDAETFLTRLIKARPAQN